MTSGTWTVGSPSIGIYATKQWSGPDGKTETVNGRKRTKWNPYTLNYNVRQVVKPRSYDGVLTVSFVYPPGGFSSYWKATDDVVLQGKLVSAVRGHDFNLAVNIAQGKQAADMVVNNLRSIGTSLFALRRGDFSTAARALGAKPRPTKLKTADVSGRWLELQYGWLPLLGDTFEAWKAYEKVTEIRKQTVRVSRSVKGQYNTTGINQDQVTVIKAGKSIIYEFEESLSTPRSLGLYDPLSVAWEIIPYSFVIDWFLPIGAYLDNLSVIPQLRGRFCNTQTYRVDGKCTGKRSGSAGYVGASTVLSRYELTRTITTGLSVVKPSLVAVPKAMSAKRIYNAIALAHQRASPSRS